MNYWSLGLGIVIPYIVYKLILKWLNNKYGIEISKAIKTLIFIGIDLLILLIMKII